MLDCALDRKGELAHTRCVELERGCDRPGFGKASVVAALTEERERILDQRSNLRNIRFARELG